MTSSVSRRAVLLGLVGASAASVAACSGETAQFSGGGSGSGGGDKSKPKTVSMSVVAGWDECIAASYLWKEILEQHDYTVNLQELDIASTFTGVANGQIDLYLDAWLPVTHEAYWKRYKNKLEVLTSWAVGTNMLAVPDYVDVTSIADLKGKGSEFGDRIVGIEAGAGLMKATRTAAMPDYGLKDFDLIEGSSPAMLAALDQAIKKKQAIVVTLWQPHWAFSRFPIRPLTDPKDAYGKPDNMQAIATKGFSGSHAELAGWMKNFKLETGQLADMMLSLQESGKGNEQAGAKAWLDKNQALVDGWLKAPAA